MEWLEEIASLPLSTLQDHLLSISDYKIFLQCILKCSYVSLRQYETTRSLSLLQFAFTMEESSTLLFPSTCHRPNHDDIRPSYRWNVTYGYEKWKLRKKLHPKEWNMWLTLYLYTWMAIHKSTSSLDDMICSILQREANTNGDIAFLYGIALSKQEQFDQAITILENIQESKDIVVLVWLAYGYAKSGRHVNSISLLKKAIEMQCHVIECLHILGWNYIQTGEYEAAKEVLERAGRMGLNIPSTSQVLLASLYGKIKDIDGQLQILNDLKIHEFEEEVEKSSVFRIREDLNRTGVQIYHATVAIQVGDWSTASALLYSALQLNEPLEQVSQVGLLFLLIFYFLFINFLDIRNKFLICYRTSSPYCNNRSTMTVSTCVHQWNKTYC